MLKALKGIVATGLLVCSTLTLFGIEVHAAAPKPTWKGNANELCSTKDVSEETTDAIKERQTAKTLAYIKKVTNALDDDQCFILRIKTSKYKGYVTIFSDGNLVLSNSTERSFHQFYTKKDSPDRLKPQLGNYEEK
jgi:hypothetical protein